MYSLFLLLSVFYYLILFSFIIGIFRLSNKRDNNLKPISIIVAARNEAKNISPLIESILLQDYPRELIELVIADDRSEDKTSDIIMQYARQYPFIKLVKITKNHPDLVGKKGAIDAAIKVANYEILAFTDADCIVGSGWLKEINAHFTDEIDFLAGYSFIDMGNKFLTGLKNLERSAIFAAISGSFGMNWAITCTAGNMAYRKSIYQKIGGFGEIGKIKSGDDDLMIQRMRNEIREMNFIFNQSAMVYTKNINNLQEHVQRESRRASKWKYYTPAIKSMTLLVFLYYLVFLAALGFMLPGLFDAVSFIIFLALKIMFESLLIALFLQKIKKMKLLIFLPIAELIYLPYFIYFGLRGTFGKYKWK